MIEPDDSFEYWWDVIVVGAIIKEHLVKEAIMIFENPDGKRYSVDLFTDLCHPI